MAATDRSLARLALAAAALPGLAVRPAAAADEEGIDIQFGHYQEGEVDLGGVRSKHAPIQADSLHARLALRFTGRWRAAFNYVQDAWSGATAVASAPLVSGPNVTWQADGVTGASPYLYLYAQLDERLRPVRRDANGIVAGPDTRVAQTITGASREVRRQLDGTFTREFDLWSMDVGAGTSREPDYRSDFASLAAHWRLGQDRYTLNAALSATSSMTDATLDHDGSPYVYGYYDFLGDNSYNQRHTTSLVKPGDMSPVIHGGRSDWTAGLSLATVITKRSLLEMGVGASRSRGYLGNPYKAMEVAFLDPRQQFGRAGGNPGADYEWDAQVIAIPEERPDTRNGQTFDLRYVRQVGRHEAALHAGYRYYRDDWGIHSHTVELQWVQPLARGWTLTPSVRWYAQSQADFYAPWITSRQGLLNPVTDPQLGQLYINGASPHDGHVYFEDPSIPAPIDNDPNSWNFGNPITGTGGYALVDRTTGKAVDTQDLASSLMPWNALYDQSLLPRHYSADTRLAAFGMLSGSLAIGRAFDNGLSLAFSWEHMRRSAALGLGGGYDTRFADRDADLFSLTLRGELHATAGHPAHAGHVAGDAAMLAPADFLGAHAHAAAGSWMIGYRVERERQGGAMRRDGRVVGDAELVASACPQPGCYARPTDMSMTMQMLEVGYTIRAGLALMAMPQFVDMRMAMRSLVGAPPGDGMGPIDAASMHMHHPHTTSGVGDTPIMVLWHGGDELRFAGGLGISVPTGAAGLRMRPVMARTLGYLDYDMQAGSGTWDLLGAMSVAGGDARLAWGAQAEATLRTGGHNDHGYARGNLLRAYAWAGARLAGPWSVSMRLAWRHEAPMAGAYAGTLVPIVPGDQAWSVGGTRLDAGAGLSLALPALGGMHDRLTLEWLQPLSQRLRGYQLDRQGSVGCSLSLAF